LPLAHAQVDSTDSGDRPVWPVFILAATFVQVTIQIRISSKFLGRL
jgi:hypothetical protein